MSDNFGTRDNQKKKEAQFYSRIRFQDQKQNYSMSFKYWNGLLGMEISKASPSDDGGVQFQLINAAYFSPMKARLFSLQLAKFTEDKKSGSVGINLGAGETQKCVTIEHGKEADIIRVCDVTPDGNKEKEVSFEFTPDRNFALDVKNYSKLDFDKVFYNGLETEIIRDMMVQFANGMLGGYAYGVMDFQRFQDSRVNSNLNKIMDKLGIETNYSGGGGYSNRGSVNDSFFNKNGAAASAPRNTGSTHREIDELDDLLDD